MYSYNLIIKAGRIEDMDALVNRQLTRRFGPEVSYYFHSKTTQEAVVIVSDESKRHLHRVLGEWFAEAGSIDVLSYPEGTLLHYRQILRDEPTHILNKIGGSANE